MHCVRMDASLGIFYLTLVLVQSTWWTIIPNTCKAPQISTKRRRRHGCEGVARLELTERVGRSVHLRYLLEPGAGGRGMAATTDGSMASSSSISNRRAGLPQCGAEVSTTSCPCALWCLSYPLADVSHACRRSRAQELSSEVSWQLFLMRRASTTWSCFWRRGLPMSAIRAPGELRMSRMGAGEHFEGSCSSVGVAGSCASGCSRTCCCGFSWRLCGSVIFVISVLPACRVESIPIA